MEYNNAHACPPNIVVGTVLAAFICFTDLCCESIHLPFRIRRNLSKITSKLLLAAIAGAGAVAAARIMRSKYDFENKTVLITGGSRGLGLVLARQLADEGAKIAVCARDAEELARAKDDLESRGADVFTEVCDVRNQDDVSRLVENVRSRFGQIDVLINNAGVIQVGPLELQTPEDFAKALAVHFWGPFHTMHSVLPEMRKRGEGRIVNISSIGGKIPVPHLAPYCASKFALAGLSSAMHADLSKDNINITTVYPGLMRTGSHVNAMFKGQNEKEFALFSLGDATPLTSIGVERAAAQIIDACRYGKSELIITIQAKAAAKMYALFPGVTSGILALVDRLLPGPGGIGTQQASGSDSKSTLSPSFITAGIDQAAVENNEL